MDCGNGKDNGIGATGDCDDNGKLAAMNIHASPGDELVIIMINMMVMELFRGHACLSTIKNGAAQTSRLAPLTTGCWALGRSAIVRRSSACRRKRPMAETSQARGLSCSFFMKAAVHDRRLLFPHYSLFHHHLNLVPGS